MTISNENDFLRSLQFSDYDFNDVLNTSIPIKKKEDIPTTDLRSFSPVTLNRIDVPMTPQEGLRRRTITNSDRYTWTTNTPNPSLESNGKRVTNPDVLMRLSRNSDDPALASAASQTFRSIYGKDIINIMTPYYIMGDNDSGGDY